MEEIKTAIEIPKIEVPENYYDEEGLLCCGKCHERLQERNEKPLPFSTRYRDRHPIPCKCRREQMEKEQAEKELREHLLNVEHLKSVCFTSPAMRKWNLKKADLSRMEHEDLVRSYIEHWPEMRGKNIGQLYYGGSGTGKTFNAACIANALMEKEIPVLMRSMSCFLNADFADREELLWDVRRYELFILDDLGMERGTDYGLETVFDVVNARYESNKPMIVTTNLSLNTLKNPEDLAHQRIYDRVLEICPPVQYGGKSIRGDIARGRFESFAESVEHAGYGR